MLIRSYPTGHPLHPDELKNKHRATRDGYPEGLALRVHRSLSWLMRAEQEGEDQDVRFILLWISFNAAYAGDVDKAVANERVLFSEFFSSLIKLDSTHRIYDVVWARFSQEIRLLLENQYVFSPFWKHINGEPGYEDWEKRLESSRFAIKKAIQELDTAKLLSILFDRLYVLRNQLIHGGATWNSSVNRSQVGDGASLIGCLLPVFIDLMMDNPEQPWPAPNYPVVE